MDILSAIGNTSLVKLRKVVPAGFETLEARNIGLHHSDHLTQ